MKKEWRITEEEFEAIKEALESILGYCGTWGMTDIIECKKTSGHSVGMRVDVFLDSLKRKFIIKN